MLADVAKKTGSKQSRAAEKRTNQGCAGPVRRDTQAGGSKARLVGQGGDWALSAGQTAHRDLPEFAGRIWHYRVKGLLYSPEPL